MTEYAHKNYSQLREAISMELENFLVSEDGIKPNIHTISAHKYDLEFHGIPICPTAFETLRGVSLDFLEHLVQKKQGFRANE